MRSLSLIKNWTSLLIKEKRRLLPILLLDLAFFVLFALLHTVLVLQALPDLAAINQLVAEESQNVPQIPQGAENVDPSQLQFSFPIERFQEKYVAVLKFAALYLLVMFALYNIVFAYTWLKTSIIIRERREKPMPYLTYLRRFAAVNAAWLLGYLLLFYLAIQAATATMFGQMAIISPVVVDAVAVIFGVLLLYLAMVSHALLPDHKALPLLKRTVVVGVRRIATVGPAFLLIMLFYYFLVQLGSWAADLSPWLAFMVFLLLFVPWTTASRVLFAAVALEAAKK